MRKKCILSWLYIPMVVVILLSINVSSKAANEDVKEMVRLVREAHKKNLEKIQTWKGKGAVSHQVPPCQNK